MAVCIVRIVLHLLLVEFGRPWLCLCGQCGMVVYVRVAVCVCSRFKNFRFLIHESCIQLLGTPV